MENNKDNLSLENLEQMVLKLQKEGESLKKSNSEKKEMLKKLEEEIKENED